jgi:hypothetical protein
VDTTPDVPASWYPDPTGLQHLLKRRARRTSQTSLTGQPPATRASTHRQGLLNYGRTPTLDDIVCPFITDPTDVPLFHAGITPVPRDGLERSHTTDNGIPPSDDLGFFSAKGYPAQQRLLDSLYFKLEACAGAEQIRQNKMIADFTILSSGVEFQPNRWRY